MRERERGRESKREGGERKRERERERERKRERVRERGLPTHAFSAQAHREHPTAAAAEKNSQRTKTKSVNQAKATFIVM